MEGPERSTQLLSRQIDGAHFSSVCLNGPGYNRRKIRSDLLRPSCAGGNERIFRVSTNKAAHINAQKPFHSCSFFSMETTRKRFPFHCCCRGSGQGKRSMSFTLFRVDCLSRMGSFFFNYVQSKYKCHLPHKFVTVKLVCTKTLST